MKDNNDYISYSSSEYSVTLDAIQEKLMKTWRLLTGTIYTKRENVGLSRRFHSLFFTKVEYGKNLLDVKLLRIIRRESRF